jgi:hypothetical protein
MLTINNSPLLDLARSDHRAGFNFSRCVTLAPRPVRKSEWSIHTRCTQAMMAAWVWRFWSALFEAA